MILAQAARGAYTPARTGMSLPYSIYENRDSIDQGAIGDRKRLCHMLQVAQLHQAKRSNGWSMVDGASSGRYTGASEPSGRQQTATRTRTGRFAMKHSIPARTLSAKSDPATARDVPNHDTPRVAFAKRSL